MMKTPLTLTGHKKVHHKRPTRQIEGIAQNAFGCQHSFSDKYILEKVFVEYSAFMSPK